MRIRLSRATIFDFKSPAAISDGIRLLVCGESGAGKSTAAVLILEQMLAQGGQVVLLDPHQEYAALWNAAPSDVVRFGYGDEPVTMDSVEECLNLVRDGKSLLIDLSHWVLEAAELGAFVLAFVKGLYRLRVAHPQATMLCVEEAQLFCPQQQIGGQAEGIQLFVGVANGGRKFGLSLMLLSQRISLIDSNVVGSVNLRILMRTTEVRDWKRIKLYLPETMGIEYEDLKSMKSGEAIVLSRWSPEAKIQL